MEKNILHGEGTSEICFGKDFENFDNQMDALIFKLHNTYVNILAMGFNDLCLDNKQAKYSCILLQEDFEMLEFSNYDIEGVIEANFKKYVGPKFTLDQFLELFKTLKYIISKWEKWAEEIDNRKDIIKGRVWNFFLKELEQIQGNKLFNSSGADMFLLSQPGGEDKLFAKKLMDEIKNNFSQLKDEYGDFLTENGIKDEHFHKEDESQVEEQNRKLQDSILSKISKEKSRIVKEYIKDNEKGKEQKE